MNTQKTNNRMKNTFPYIILCGVIAAILIIVTLQGNKVNELTTGELMQNLKDNNVTEILITPNSNESVYYVEGKLKGYKETESFKAKIIEGEVAQVTEYLTKNDIEEYDTESDPGSSAFLYILVNVLPFAVVIIFGYVLVKKLAMSNKSSVDFGRSRARLSNDSDKKTFNDVAGLTEEKEEVAELIDFLKIQKNSKN